MLDDAAEFDAVALLGGWTRAPGPLYRRLADALRAAIARGALAAGERLPPERGLAERLGVSRSTVVAAFDELENERLIVRQQGSGTRVRSQGVEHARADSNPRVSTPTTNPNRNAFFRRITNTLDETIDLVGAYLLTDQGLPSRFLADVMAQVSEFSRSSGYFPLGHPELRRAIATYLSTHGLPTTSDEVVVTTGAQQAIHLSASLFLAAGDTVVVENPTYPGALDAFAGQGARLTCIRTGRAGADVDGLAEVVARTAPRLVYLIPTFQNPVGGLMPESRRRTVARVVEDAQVALVDDESLIGLGLEELEVPPPIASFAPRASILTIGSVSKLGWGGLRVGWIRAPEEIVARLGRLKAVVDLGGSVPGQLIAAHVLDDFEALRVERRVHLCARFDLVTRALQRHLPSWSWDMPRGGLCLWVRLPYGNAFDFAEVAARHGVSIVGGPVASADASFGDYLRLPFGHEPAILEEAIRRLAAAWDAFEPRAPSRAQRLSVIV